jgi:HEAT repeat protein
MRRQMVSRIDTPRSQASGDDKLEIRMKPHPFIFSRDPKNPLNEQIVETINRMGGVGEDAEKRYQACLNALFRQAREVVAIVEQELKDQPADSYLDRWSLVYLLAELKQPQALQALDAILSARVPEERYKDPHNFTSVGEEVVIRTTAVDAIMRIAADGVKEAQEMLLKHVRHDNFSVKRAAVQAFLQVAGEGGRETLMKNMPESDHHILDIKAIDVRQAPQAEGGLHLKPCDREELPALGTESDLGGKDPAGKSDKGCGCK